MTDIDAPARYAEPAADQTSREGNVELVVALALRLAVAAVALAMISREMAEPFVLAILGGLAVVGVFCLFAGAVGILHFGQSQARNDVTKAFVDNLPQGALIADQSGRVIYANEAYRNLLGLEPGMVMQPPDRAFAGSAYLAEQIFRLSRAAHQGRALREEFRLPPLGEADEDPGVRPRWFRISVQPMPAEPGAGRKGGLVVWQVDEVTSDRERQEAGFEKVQQAIAYLDNAPAGFFTADGDGTIDYLNATLAQWLGLDLADVAGGHLKLAKIMSEDGAALIARAGRRGHPGRHAAFRHRSRQGGRHHASRAHPALPAAPRRARPCARAEPRAWKRGGGRRRRASLCQAVQLRPHRHRHGRPRGHYQHHQRRFVRLFGRAVDGVPARKVTLASLADADGAESLRKALDAAIAGQGMIEPVDIAFEDDKERSGRVYLSPVERAEGESEAAIAYAIDTTAQNALEMQFQQAQKMQAIGQLAGGVAHDFNNILQAIIGNCDLLLDAPPAGDPPSPEINEVRQNAVRAAGLVRQLLAFSRQQTLQPRARSPTRWASCRSCSGVCWARRID